jgi:hypothetical protein
MDELERVLEANLEKALDVFAIAFDRCGFYQIH